MESDVQQLAQTLLASKLAASNSEAQRMAREMLGVAAKVNADEKKDQIYAVHGYGTPKSAAAPISNPTPSAEAAAFSSPEPAPQASSQRITLDNPVLTTQPHPNMSQQQQAAWQATTSPSPESAPVDQGEVVSPTHEEPVQESYSNPTPSENSWADESSSKQSQTEPEAVSVNLESNHETPSQNYAPSQQASMLATESLGTTNVDRPEDRFASQFEGKTLAELSGESQEQQQAAFEPQEQTNSSSTTDSSSDFLNLRSQPNEEQQMSNNAASAPSLSTGWPSEEPQATEQMAQPEPAPAPVQEQPETTQEVAAQEQPERKGFSPAQSNEVTSAPEKKGFSEEEKKLADEVDLAKVFNFGNR